MWKLKKLVSEGSLFSFRHSSSSFSFDDVFFRLDSSPHGGLMVVVRLVWLCGERGSPSTARVPASLSCSPHRCRRGWWPGCRWATWGYSRGRWGCRWSLWDWWASRWGIFQVQKRTEHRHRMRSWADFYTVAIKLNLRFAKTCQVSLEPCLASHTQTFTLPGVLMSQTHKTAHLRQ